MEYTITDVDGVREVALSGDLTYESTDTFTALVEALEQDRIAACVLDLGELDFIDSAGLGLLVLTKANTARAGIALSLRNPRGQVLELFELAEFHRIIPCEFVPPREQSL